MKSIKPFSQILLVTLLSLSACTKDFLNEPKPTQQVSANDVFQTEEGVWAYFNGIYSRLRSQWTNLNSSAGGTTDSWGIVSINLTREQKGDDVINPGGWYQFDYRHENREPTYRRVIFTWAYFYEFINQANLLLDGVAKGALAEPAKKRFTAEARALRAWLYFEAVREFQHTYLKDPNAPGIPLYTGPTSPTTQGAPRGTLKDVYALINTDIDFAVANLDENRTLKSNINRSVAYGLQARINLEQGQWAKAKEAASKARQGYTLNAAEYKNGFTDVNSAEWMWAFPNTETDAQTLYYGIPNSFWGKMGEGYDNFFINEAFVQRFSSTDVRKLFYNTGSPSAQRRWATSKFGETINFNAAMPMMRVSEMYLIEAEAMAELGEADAGSTLYTLQKNRDSNMIKSENTGRLLVNEILLERRKELYGELGVNFLDLKRRQLPLVRTGNHPAAFRFTIPANDPRFILKIPQREIDANDTIGPQDQNQ